MRVGRNEVGWAGRVGALAALFLAALALRPQLVGLGPLLPQVQDDLGMTHAVAGLLGTIPVLCMGLFAPPAAFVSGRFGSRRAVGLCLALIAGFGLLRAMAPGALPVIALTFGVGLGMGLAGALLPVAVKERFSDRPAFATGVYATGIQLGSAASAAVAVPIAAAAGGWRSALVAFSLLAVVLFVVWFALTGGGPAHRRSPARPPRLPWRSGVGWVLVAVFGLLSVIYYGLTAWLPNAYVERGWLAGDAGALIAAMNALALPASLLVPWLADRAGSRRFYMATAAVAQIVALLGFVLVPDAAWLWILLVGPAGGILFSLILTLPLDVSDRPDQVGAVAGLMFGAGYALSAVAPVGLGAARDATGSFVASLWVLVAVSGLLLLASLTLTHERLHRGIGREHPFETDA